MRFDERDAMFEGEVRRAPAPGRVVRARILWPALGFPAVIAPRSGAAVPANAADSDATRTICVLVLTDTPNLTPEDASRYLRCVPWQRRDQRTIRSGEAGWFPPSALTVVNGLSEGGAEDKNARALSFGSDRQQRNGITVSLSRHVREFYRKHVAEKDRLAHLHEIRVSEAAVSRLFENQYHLFWNQEIPGRTSHSNEMRLLLDRFVPGRVPATAGTQQDRDLLLNGYRFEYGGLHAPYNARDSRLVPTEVLHPVFMRRNLLPAISIGHVTDTHVDIRNDVYARNLARESAQVSKATGGRRIVFNNWNESFELVYKDAKSKSDVILMTGDLIDYGRGHIGNASAHHTLGRDLQYYKDRNWFLFYFLLASKGNYGTPVYTSLGNHDWRLNPYPPFAPGAPDPVELVHNTGDFKSNEVNTVLKRVVEIAHGPGFDKGYAYADLARDVVEIVKSAWKAKSLVPSLLFGNRANLDFSGLPTHTTVDSVAWYLLIINPFLDYQFSLHTGHQFLVLDFAEQEDLKDEREGQGNGPRALNCLTQLQQWHIERLSRTPGAAKTIGMHVPPLGPRPDWTEGELLQGQKTYTYPQTPQYRRKSDGEPRWIRNTPVPLMAITPETFSKWLAAVYGSFVSKGTREWMLKKLFRSNVRLVLSGHIHRQGLLAIKRRALQLPPASPREPATLMQVWAIQKVQPQQVKDAVPPYATRDRLEGPLYVNTTSAGPKGFQYTAKDTYQSMAPGYSRIELSSDGKIGVIEFVAPSAAPTMTARAQAR